MAQPSGGAMQIVNQIDKRARRKTPQVIIVLMIAISLSIGAAFAIRYAEDVEAGKHAEEDMKLPDGVDPEDLEDYMVTFQTVVKYTQQGQNLDERVTYEIVSADGEVEKIPANSDGPGDGLWSDTAGSEPSCPDQKGFWFSTYWHVIKPTKRQTDTHHIKICLDEETGDQRKQFNVKTGEDGFGEYRLRYTIQYGDVDWCWYRACWTYYADDHQDNFELKDNSKWWR